MTHSSIIINNIPFFFIVNIMPFTVDKMNTFFIDTELEKSGYSIQLDLIMLLYYYRYRKKKR